ncbi:MAG: glycosyltransferase family 39 protein [Alphaproteobacteria bacterium]|nr:glycosyltransferase family 39 protein [Alphaproteobacteria bacterium]
MGFWKISGDQNGTWNKFNLFILIYIAVFSLIPILTRNVIPFDMVENLYWGKEWQLGYEKHPPLFAWISQAFFKLSFSIPESLYILTQLNLLLGLVFVFKISQFIYNDRIKSYASVFIFMSSAAAILGNEKFNATTILFSLLPATFYYFLKMMKFGRKRDAVLLGTFAALSFIGKYIALLFFGCMGLFLLFNSNCRKILRTPLPYISIAVFLVGISWHVYWIYSNDFVTIRYALEKSALAKKSPMFALKFLLMMCFFFITSFIAACFAFRSNKSSIEKKFKLSEMFRDVNFVCRKNENYSTEELFVITMTLAPSAILFLSALFTGMRIGSFWGACMMTMIGIYLVIINRKLPNIASLFKFTKWISCFFAVILILKLGLVRQILRDSHPSYAIDYKTVSRQIEQDYSRVFPNKKIENIISDKNTTPLHLYLKDSPCFYNPKIHRTQKLFTEKGNNLANRIATFIYKDYAEVENFRKFYDSDIIFEKDIGICGSWKLHYAFFKNQYK